MATRILLQDVRLSFPKLWTPEQFNGTGPFAWSASFLLDPAKPAHAKQIAEIEEIMRSEFKAKCGDKFDAKWDNLEWDSKCLRDGKKKPESDGYEGMMYVAARATKGTHSPPLVMNRRRVKMEDAGGDGAPYGGAYVNAQVEIWGQYGTYKRVNATLLGVQMVRDGDAFGGGRPVDPDAFADLGDQGDDENGDLSGLV